jgi:hypothetical protein
MTPTVGSSIAGSMFHGVDLDELFSVNEEVGHVGKFLRRSRSANNLQEHIGRSRDREWWPRNLSFSVTEESVLTWDRAWVLEPDFVDPNEEPPKQHKRQQLVAEDAKWARAALADTDTVATWVDQNIDHIKSLEELVESDMQELDNMYYPRLEEYQRLRLESQEALAGAKQHLTEMLKDVEVLGAKLEYEISALRSKVEDVEEGVNEFARQVASVETMVGELEARYKGGAGGARSWLDWAYRSIAAFGTKLSRQQGETATPASTPTATTSVPQEPR